ncbi:MAG: response regulator [Pseudomonadota bacterium]
MPESPQISNPPQSLWKRLLFFSIPILILITAVDYLTYRSTATRQMARLEKYTRGLVTRQKNLLRHPVNEAAERLSLLADLVASRLTSAAGSEEGARVALEDIGIFLHRESGRLENVTLVDERSQTAYGPALPGGVQAIRPDKTPGAGPAGAGASLELLAPPAGDKAGGAKLKLTVPLSSPSGERLGVLSAEVSPAGFISQIASWNQGDVGDLFVTDNTGVCLFSLQPGGECASLWGRDPAEGKNGIMPARFPQAWTGMVAAENGQFSDRDGLWTFSSFDPSSLAEGGAEKPDGPGPPWKIISFLDDETLAEDMRPVVFQISFLTGLFFIFMALFLKLYEKFRRANREVGEELIKLSQAVEQSPVTVMITDTAGRIVYVNRKFVETTGYSREEDLGRNPSILKSGKQPPEVYRRLWEDVSRGREWRGELRNRRKDGELYWEFASISPIKDHKGEIAYFLAMKENITERKRAEVELRKAIETAEAANQAKSEFLANMSHEIRTPLNGIIGMTGLLMDTDLNGEQREYLGLVIKSTEVLLLLINGILDLSKIESGRFELDLRPFRLRETLAQALKTLAPLAEEKGLVLAFDVDDAVPEDLIGDPVRVRQIILNLMGNAVKFTRRGEVTCEVHPRNAAGDKVTLHFKIKDTGIGIPVGKQRDIFSPFTQADGSLTREFGGTGLGLSISSQLVEMMGGRIWVESEVDVGSVFHFTADFLLESRAEEKNTTNGRPLQGVRVLVVDDKAIRRGPLRRLLRNWGLEALAAVRTEQALATLETAEKQGEPLQVVILDANLPDDGSSLIQEFIAEKNKEYRLGLIVLTARAPKSRPCNDGEETARRVLTKPPGPRELREALLWVLGLAGGRAKDQASSRPGLEATTPLRVMVAEDNPVNQQVAKRLLEKQGHQVIQAATGREAVEKFDAEGPFDLILMDVQMPDLNGLEATGLIRVKEKPGQRVFIAAMTAMAMKGDREKCLEAGMDGYMSKPISPDELTRMLVEAMRRKELGYVQILGTEQNDPVIDEPDLMKRIGDDAGLLKEIVYLFLDEVRSLERDLIAAAAAADARALKKAVQSTRAAVRNFSAKRVLGPLKRLEDLAESGNLAQVGYFLEIFQWELKNLESVLLDLQDRKNIRE